MYGEPSNTFIMFSVLYHEELAVSLLESTLFHSDSIEAMEDKIIDLIDYAVSYLTMIIYSNDAQYEDETPEYELISISNHYELYQLLLTLCLLLEHV